MSARIDSGSSRPVSAQPVAIDRQLHDIVIPQLFMVTTGLKALSRRGRQGDDALLGDLVEAANQALTDLRAITRGERAGAGGTLADLACRMENAMATVASLADCVVAVRLDDDDGGDAVIEPALADDLVAFAREAVANAVRHGGSRRADITIRSSPDTLTVSVLDDGRWVEPTGTPGSGLAGLDGRAARWGGQVAVVSRDDGTRVEWRSPPLREGVRPS